MIFKRVSWRRRIQIWQDRRQPPVSSEQLSQRNVYILPSSKSVGYSIAIILLWLIGTNYENNLVLALSYLLMALYVSVIHATHRNLSGLCVEISDSSQVFAGESVDIQLKLTNSAKRARYRLRFRWDGTEGTTVDVSEQEQTTLELSLPTEKRGWLIPSRLHIETTYPLGILRAWSLPQLRAPMLVFPKPVAIEATSGDSATGAEGQASTPGIDEFGGLESWQAGVPMQRIAWKQYSAGKGLLEKKFEAQSLNPEWLDWDTYTGLGTEARLSAICAQALEIEKLGQHYGLRIPGQILSPAQGEQHLLQVLTALACFDDPQNDASRTPYSGPQSEAPE